MIKNEILIEKFCFIEGKFKDKPDEDSKEDTAIAKPSTPKANYAVNDDPDDPSTENLVHPEEITTDVDLEKDLEEKKKLELLS